MYNPTNPNSLVVPPNVGPASGAKVKQQKQPKQPHAMSLTVRPLREPHPTSPGRDKLGRIVSLKATGIKPIAQQKLPKIKRLPNSQTQVSTTVRQSASSATNNARFTAPPQSPAPTPSLPIFKPNNFGVG